MEQADPPRSAQPFDSLRIFLHRWLPVFPWLVFVLALSLTFTEWELKKNEAHAALQRQFDSQADNTFNTISKRTQTYEDLLRGVQALFAWHKVEEEEFAAYVKALDIDKHYAGLHTINFIAHIAEGEKEKHEQFMRGKGHLNYAIHPSGVRSFYAPLTYIEPSARRDSKLYGFDTFTNPTILRAREQARDTGEAAISGKILMAGAATDKPRTGFTMNLPLYIDGVIATNPNNRRMGLHGWVEASFQMDELMHTILDDVRDLDVEVYDGINATPATLLFSSSAPKKGSAQLKKEERIQIGGRQWTVIINARPEFQTRINDERAGMALQAGLGMSFLLLLTTWLLVRGQARARLAANQLAQELTARKNVEAGLQASENRLQEIIDILPIALFIKDTQSRFLLLNRACEAQFGMKSADLLGNDGSQYFPSEQMQQFLQMDRQVFANGKLVEFDESVWNAQLQQNRSVHTYKKPVFDEKGEAQYLICMTVDVTERTRTEEWLRLLETCVARLNDVVFITEANRRPEDWPKIIFVNDAFEKQTGYSREEAVGHTSAILRGPNTSRAELQRLAQAMREWRPIRSELINYHKSGREIWMELELVPITDANGNYIYWVTVARDISERKQAETALRASEAMHRDIIDHAPLPLLVSDMESDQVVYGNLRCAGMLGVNPEDLTSNTACTYFADPLQRRELAAKVRALGVINDVEIQLSDCGQRHFWALVSMVASRYEGRSAIISALVDISAAKQTQEQLREAREKADSANAAKSAFLSNMSHEIRTPMNSILGMTYLALATTLDNRQRDYLEKIHLSGQHLLALIDDILDFSKIEAGMFTIEKTPFDLHELLSRLSDLMTQRIRAKGLHFHLLVDDMLDGKFLGDPLRLLQILINLTGNALKFTERGEIKLRVQCLQQGAQESSLYFAVEDSGIGMSEQQMQLLFKPFQQADVSSSRKYGGTGLGLAISRQLVELMQGEIGVHSTVQQGSTFWFRIDLERNLHQQNQTLPEPAAPQTVAELITQARLSLQGRRVLLAEDSPLNQQVALELLQSVGVEVVLANDGHQALQALRQSRFDCVLMDVQMPDMDGLEATRAIRTTPTLADTVIIAMTANASAQDRSQCLAAGMHDFISKPIKPALLYATLAKWMPVKHAISEQEADPGWIGLTLDQNLIDAIDLTPLTDLIGDDPQLIKKFVNMFFDSADSQMQEIELALESGDQTALARLLHGLRGEACAMGAQELGALCRKMETSLDDINLAQQLFANLQTMLGQVKQVMRAQIDRHSAEYS